MNKRLAPSDFLAPRKVAAHLQPIKATEYLPSVGQTPPSEWDEWTSPDDTNGLSDAPLRSPSQKSDAFEVRRKFGRRLARPGSTFSGVGASGKQGVVH